MMTVRNLSTFIAGRTSLENFAVGVLLSQLVGADHQNKGDHGLQKAHGGTEAVLQALQADAARRQAVISEFIHDLRAPGQQFRSQRPPPLIERNPVLFWQASTLVLALVALALAFRQA